LTNDLNAKLSLWAASMGLPAINMSKLRSLSVDAQVHAGVMNVPEAIRILIANAVTHVIFLSIIVVIIAFSATLMIPELPMRERPKVPPKDALPADAHM